VEGNKVWDHRVPEAEQAKGCDGLEPRVLPCVGGHGLELVGRQHRRFLLVEDLGHRQLEARQIVERAG